MSWTAHIDGGSRGNPGPAAAGVVIRDETGQKVLAAGFFLGRATNNQAEYNGLLRAIEFLQRARARQVEIVSDSELMVRQINGQYKVRSAELRPLYEEAIAGLEAFKWRMRHVLRAHNTDADGLANEAMDARADVIRIDRLGLLGRATGSPSAAPAVAPPVAGAQAAGPPPAPPAPRARGNAAHEALPQSAPARRIDGPPATVEARVTQGPAPGQCPAGVRLGQPFTFQASVPAGFCLHLCTAALPAILQMQQSPTVTAQEIRCSRPRCGAVLELRMSPDSARPKPPGDV